MEKLKWISAKPAKSDGKARHRGLSQRLTEGMATLQIPTEIV